MSSLATLGMDMQIVEAPERLLPSLETIFSRSFHPVNPYMKQCIPDTPLIRDWWRRTLEDEIRTPNCHIFVAVSKSEVYGMLCLRLLQPADPSIGCFTSHPLTADHDADLFPPMVAMVKEARDNLMQPHQKQFFLIECLAVDYKQKGQGLGTRLLERACEIADKARTEIMVQANMTAVDFYARFGFEGRMVKEMPSKSGEVYSERILIRAPREERTEVPVVRV